MFLTGPELDVMVVGGHPCGRLEAEDERLQTGLVGLNEFIMCVLWLWVYLLPVCESVECLSVTQAAGCTFAFQVSELTSQWLISLFI